MRNPNHATHQSIISLQHLLTRSQQTRSGSKRLGTIRCTISKFRRPNGSWREPLWRQLLELSSFAAPLFDRPVLPPCLVVTAERRFGGIRGESWEGEVLVVGLRGTDVRTPSTFLSSVDRIWTLMPCSQFENLWFFRQPSLSLQQRR